MAGTRAQSGDRYGSGTLHSRQFLRGRLPLLSPVWYILLLNNFSLHFVNFISNNIQPPATASC